MHSGHSREHAARSRSPIPASELYCLHCFHLFVPRNPCMPHPRVTSCLPLLPILLTAVDFQVNELCSANDYLPEEPSPSEISLIKENHGQECSSRGAEELKIVLSIITLALLACVVSHKWVEVCEWMPSSKMFNNHVSGSFYETQHCLSCLIN